MKFFVPLDLAPQNVDALGVLYFRSDCRKHAFYQIVDVAIRGVRKSHRERKFSFWPLRWRVGNCLFRSRDINAEINDREYLKSTPVVSGPVAINRRHSLDAP